MCVCLQWRKTTPVLQPHWFPLTQNPLCSQHTVALKTQFIGSYREVFGSAQTPSVAELYYLYCSLGLLDCVRLLTTSSAGQQTCCCSRRRSENKEPFECVSVKTCWLFRLSRRVGGKKATQKKERVHHSDFILFTFTFSVVQTFAWHKEGCLRHIQTESHACHASPLLCVLQI